MVFLNTALFSQKDDELKNYGFIEIKTDSMNVPFFVDGYFVGNYPLDEPIAVLPGFHEVSYIPPDIQDEKIKDNLSEGIKRIYVAKDDTLEVFLFYDHYLSQVEVLQEELKVQKYVGFSLFGVLVYVLLAIL
ncbi:MAG: hypothetical protein CMG60_02905 [Candidatus Marinimicrobia bacterium]|nr:hypothetical protein [Candidatus Neomarinimicrobiota bacterium]|tara:strand:+ start:677 stop:1072 length:396 start_codon:yes stop_codon:yes gene_type:complete